MSWRPTDIPFAHAPAPQDPRDVVSVGAGIHFVQLLVLGSMIGHFVYQKLHPKIINDLAMGLIMQILRFAPTGILPGNVLEVRSFDCFSGRLESQTLDANHMRVENFIRPNDVFFAESGELSRCRNFGNFAAEDLLHMGPLCEVARIIGCKLIEVPASAEATYYIRPMKSYCVLNPLTGVVGTLFSDCKTVSLEARDSSADAGSRHKAFGLLTWQDELRAEGFIMLPMVWRSGACVAWEGRVGCIVPHEEPADGNFGLESLDYKVALGREETIYLPALDTLEKLLPIGQRLFLRLESQAAAPMVRKLTEPIDPGLRSRCALRVHVDSPNTVSPVGGKVYVVCLVRRVGDNDQPAGSKCEMIVADPWELMIQPEGRRVFENVSE